MGSQGNRLLEVTGLKKYFPVKKSFLKKTTSYVKAVDDIDIYVDRAETLGIIGESGSGKTTIGRCILRIYEPTEGQILFNRENGFVSVTEMDSKRLKEFRRHAQMVFQNPYACLNPRMTVLDIIGEPLVIHGLAKGMELEDRVTDVLKVVGLKIEHLRRYPHSFSGGQRQRIAIARALILKPELIICDEAVSALDVSIKAQILNLLKDLQDEFGLTYMFITHDMSVVKHMCNRIAIIYCGHIMELSDIRSFLKNPLHPYSFALISAVPKPDPSMKLKYVIAGEIPDPVNPPSGCVFHPRCKYAKDICREQIPQLRNLGDGRHVKCHFAESLDLTIK